MRPSGLKLEKLNIGRRQSPITKAGRKEIKMFLFNDVTFNKENYEVLNHFRQIANYRGFRLHEQILIKELSSNEYYLLENFFPIFFDEDIWFVENGEGEDAYQIFNISSEEVQRNAKIIQNNGLQFISNYPNHYKEISKKICYELKRIEQNLSEAITISTQEEYDKENMVLTREILTYENHMYYLDVESDMYDYEYVNDNLKTYYVCQRESYSLILSRDAAKRWMAKNKN